MRKQLTLKIKLGYASASIGDSASYTFFTSFLMFFLTTIAGVDPVIAGTISALGAIWDSLWSPIIGFVSDNLNSKFGRRRPFIFVAAFPLAIASCLTFTYIDADPVIKTIYYGAMVLLFWISFAAFFIPYLALGAEITDDYNERTTLRSYAYIMNTTGMIVGMVMPTFIVDVMINHGSSTGFAWQVTGAIVGVVSFITLMITWKTTKGRELMPKQKINVTGALDFFKQLVSGYLKVLKLKPLRILLCVSIFYLVANTMHTSDRMYFFTYNVGLSGSEITIMMLVLTALGAFYAPIVLKFAKIFDKRKVIITLLGVSAVLMTAMRFIGIESLLGLCIFSFFYACGNTAYWQLVPATVYDICELDELLHDERREGTVSSLLSLSEALSSAISMQILGIILKFSGFVGDAPFQSESTMFWVSNCFSFIPAIFSILAMIMMIKFPIGKESFSTIMRLVEKKRKGEKYDLSEINHML